MSADFEHTVNDEEVGIHVNALVKACEQLAYLEHRLSFFDDSVVPKTSDEWEESLLYE